MAKIINNQCDKNGNPYITHLDFLRTIAHYDENGEFQYLQSTNGARYDLKQLNDMKMNFDLRLLDPEFQWNKGNVLAKDQNTPKHAEVEISPKSQIKNWINISRLDEGMVSIDTARHGCDIDKLFNTKDDALKINLTEGVKANDEFAMLGGTVNLKSKQGDWIDLGLNEYELSQHKVKVTDDCKCKPDTEAFKELRDDITVKPAQSEQKVGSINLASWFFKGDKLYYDLRGDDKGSLSVEEDNIYLKVLLCDEQKPYYKLALCDKNGNIAKEAQKSEDIISKCNIISEQKFQLRDYVRDDNLPSFIIKPSTSKEFGEATSSKSRAEVYEYNPISHDIGDKIGKLNATDIRVSNKTFIIDNLLLDDNGYKTFNIDSNITVKEKGGVYHIDKSFRGPIDDKTTKLLLDDLLCLFDQNSLQDGIQIIG